MEEPTVGRREKKKLNEMLEVLFFSSRLSLRKKRPKANSKKEKKRKKGNSGSFFFLELNSIGFERRRRFRFGRRRVARNATPETEATPNRKSIPASAVSEKVKNKKEKKKKTKKKEILFVFNFTESSPDPLWLRRQWTATLQFQNRIGKKKLNMKIL